MKKEGPSSLFSFHPDPEAVKSRMIREVGALYRLGLKPERAQQTKRISKQSWQGLRFPWQIN